MSARKSTSIDTTTKRSLTPKARAAVFERDGWRCKKCRTHSPDGAWLQAHHIIEFADGGSDAIDNLDTLCAQCHAEWSWLWCQPRSVPYERWLTLVPAVGLVRMLVLGLDGLDLGLSRDLIELLVLRPTP